MIHVKLHGDWVDGRALQILEGIERGVQLLIMQGGKIMAVVDDMRALVQRVDAATTSLGLTTTGIAASLTNTSEALSAGLAEIMADLQRLRDNLGGEGGLKPGEADEIRRGLEASVARLEGVQSQVDASLPTAASQLQAHAALLTELGRDEELPPAPPAPDPVEPASV